MILAPIATFSYDPLGSTDPRYQASVFCNVDQRPPTKRRQFRIVASGGGFVPTSGEAPTELNTDTAPLQAQWVREGHVVIRVGYTVYDPNIDGKGFFDPANWLISGAGTLIVDETKLHLRHAELDFVNMIQGIRSKVLPEIPNIDRAPGKGGLLIKSAGAIAGAFAALDVDRANPRATNPRHRISTRVGWVMPDAMISSFKAYKAGLPQWHFATPGGQVPSPMGQVPPSVLAHASFLRYQRRPNGVPRTPVYMAAKSQFETGGPYTWADLDHVIGGDNVHAADFVRAVEDLPGHDPRSVFLYPQNATEPDSDERRARFVHGIEGVA